MTRSPAHDLSELPDWPELLSAPRAAAYCGMSVDSFLHLVKLGRFPQPVDLPIRRRLWQRAELNSAIAKGNAANDREARKAAWDRRRQDRAAHAG